MESQDLQFGDEFEPEVIQIQSKKRSNNNRARLKKQTNKEKNNLFPESQVVQKQNRGKEQPNAKYINSEKDQNGENKPSSFDQDTTFQSKQENANLPSLIHLESGLKIDGSIQIRKKGQSTHDKEPASNLNNTYNANDKSRQNFNQRSAFDFKDVTLNQESDEDDEGNQIGMKNQTRIQEQVDDKDSDQEGTSRLEVSMREGLLQEKDQHHQRYNMESSDKKKSKRNKLPKLNDLEEFEIDQDYYRNQSSSKKLIQVEQQEQQNPRASLLLSQSTLKIQQKKGDELIIQNRSRSSSSKVVRHEKERASMIKVKSQDKGSNRSKNENQRLISQSSNGGQSAQKGSSQLKDANIVSSARSKGNQNISLSPRIVDPIRAEDDYILQAQNMIKRQSQAGHHSRVDNLNNAFNGRDPRDSTGLGLFGGMMAPPQISIDFFGQSNSPPPKSNYIASSFMPRQSKVKAISQKEMERMQTPQAKGGLNSFNMKREKSLEGQDNQADKSLHDNTKLNQSNSRFLNNSLSEVIQDDIAKGFSEDKMVQILPLSNRGNQSDALNGEHETHGGRKIKKQKGKIPSKSFGIGAYLQQLKGRMTGVAISKNRKTSPLILNPPNNLLQNQSDSNDEKKLEESSISSAELDQEEDLKTKKGKFKKSSKKLKRSTKKRDSKMDEEKKQVLKSDFITAEFKMLNSKLNARTTYKKCIIYPENQTKQKWDLFIALLLMFTCCYTPWTLAFSDTMDQTQSTVLETCTDALFSIDIILIFFTSFYDDEYCLIDDRKKIARTYIYGYFFIDVLAVLPFDQILNTGQFNRLARVARIGKLYRLVRMTKIARLLKIVKERKKIVKYFNEIVKIGLGFERLLFFMFLFFVLCHIVACIWQLINSADLFLRIFIAVFDGSKENWIYIKGYQDMSQGELYVTAYYFTVTTIVTVGYGDITANNTGERIICIFLMIIGQVSFSIATGSLTSILSSYDSSQAKLKQKIATLNEIREQYNIGFDLFDELRKAIKYDHSKNYKDKIEFMEELPQKLKVELAMEIHKDLYVNIDFLKYQDKSFIVWVAPLLKPMQATAKEYIFTEGEIAKEIYFLVSGSAAYVLPRFEDTIYIQIEKGNHFGIIDMVYDPKVVDYVVSLHKKQGMKSEALRIFTVLALTDCELLTLTTQDIARMKLEFPDQFDQLFDNSLKVLKKAMKLKDEAIKYCEEELQQREEKLKLLAEQSTSAMNKSGQGDLTTLDDQKRPLLSSESKETLASSSILNKSGASSKIINMMAKNFMSLKKIDEELEQHEEENKEPVAIENSQSESDQDSQSDEDSDSSNSQGSQSIDHNSQNEDKICQNSKLGSFEKFVEKSNESEEAEQKRGFQDAIKQIGILNKSLDQKQNVANQNSVGKNIPSKGIQQKQKAVQFRDSPSEVVKTPSILLSSFSKPAPQPSHTPTPKNENLKLNLQAITTEIESPQLRVSELSNENQDSNKAKRQIQQEESKAENQILKLSLLPSFEKFKSEHHLKVNQKQSNQLLNPNGSNSARHAYKKQNSSMGLKGNKDIQRKNSSRLNSGRRNTVVNEEVFMQNFKKNFGNFFHAYQVDEGKIEQQDSIRRSSKTKEVNDNEKERRESPQSRRHSSQQIVQKKDFQELNDRVGNLETMMTQMMILMNQINSKLDSKQRLFDQ